MRGDALDSLARICLQTYKIDQVELKGLPKPDEHQQALLDALQINLTAPVMDVRASKFHKGKSREKRTS